MSTTFQDPVFFEEPIDLSSTTVGWQLGPVTLEKDPLRETMDVRTPNETGALAWYDQMGGFANTGDSHLNWVRRWGWNVKAGGGRVSTSYPAMADEYESRYQPGAVAQFERHFAVYGLNDVTYRPISILASWANTPHINILINADEATLGNTDYARIAWDTDNTTLRGSGGGRLAAGTTNIQLYHAAGAGRVVVDENQVTLGGHVASDQNNSSHGWDLGLRTMPFGVGYLRSGVQMGAPIGERPTADADHRGLMFVALEDAGIADQLQVCLKAADGTYSWKTVTAG